jgi:hypothetical protein
VLAFDENGLSVTDGALDHMTWHCSGLADFINGLGQARGFCAGNDPAGDQVVFNWESEEHTPDQKVVHGTFSWTGGTGKYAGIRGTPERSGPWPKEPSSAISPSRVVTVLPRCTDPRGQR